MSAGWLKRQLANTARNIYEWPEWMRREAGIEAPEKNALNDARAEIAALRARLAAAEQERERLAIDLNLNAEECVRLIEQERAKLAAAEQAKESVEFMRQWALAKLATADAALAALREAAEKIALDYAAVYMSENTFGDGRRCGEQIAAAIRALPARQRTPDAPAPTCWWDVTPDDPTYYGRRHCALHGDSVFLCPNRPPSPPTSS